MRRVRSTWRRTLGPTRSRTSSTSSTSTHRARLTSRSHPIHPVSLRRFPSFRTQPLENLMPLSTNKWVPEQPSPWRKSSKRESCYGDRVYRCLRTKSLPREPLHCDAAAEMFYQYEYGPMMIIYIYIYI